MDHITIASGYNDDSLSNPGVLADLIVSILKESDVQFDTIVASGVSGMMIAPVVGFKMNIPVVAVRKPSDSTHSRNLVQGKLGKRWLFLDDFISSGTTLKRVFDAINEHADREGWETEFVGVMQYLNGGSFTPPSQYKYKLGGVNTRDIRENERVEQKAQSEFARSLWRGKPREYTLDDPSGMVEYDEPQITSSNSIPLRDDDWEATPPEINPRPTLMDWNEAKNAAKFRETLNAAEMEILQAMINGNPWKEKPRRVPARKSYPGSDPISKRKRPRFDTQ